MYQIAEYTSVNNLGTAVLLEALVKRRVERLVVASNGEGLYKDSRGEIRDAAERTLNQLRTADWEVRDDRGDKDAVPFLGVCLIEFRHSG